MSESETNRGSASEDAAARTDGERDDDAAATAPPPAPPMPRRRRRALRWLLVAAVALVVLPVLGFVAWSWASLTFSFSEGRRVGYVQKFSRKGWVCKTWEGELTMFTVPGTMPQLFAFSVRDETVAREIERAMGEGRPVSIDYRQHRGVPSNCFGETEYFVVGVRAVAPGTTLPSVTPTVPPPAKR